MEGSLLAAFEPCTRCDELVLAWKLWKEVSSIADSWLVSMMDAELRVVENGFPFALAVITRVRVL